MKIRYVVISCVVIVAALWMRSPCWRGQCCGVAPGVAAPAVTAAPGATVGIPRLIDLGRTMCIPCKMMAPILEELKKEYAGRLYVEFIDVGKKPEEARKYRINMIPTQVFLDATGKELYRHTGFFSKEDILKKWKELGVDLSLARDSVKGK